MTLKKTVISQKLAVLIGLELSCIRRAADMLNLQFGPLKQVVTRRGTVTEVGVWALHIQCDWHIEQSNHMFANQIDLHGTDDAADQTIEKLNKSLVIPTKTVVEHVRANSSGGVWIDLSHDWRIVITPDGVAGEEDWRFFAHDDDGPHFVIEGGRQLKY